MDPELERRIDVLLGTAQEMGRSGASTKEDLLGFGVRVEQRRKMYAARKDLIDYLSLVYRPRTPMGSHHLGEE